MQCDAEELWSCLVEMGTHKDIVGNREESQLATLVLHFKQAQRSEESGTRGRISQRTSPQHWFLCQATFCHMTHLLLMSFPPQTKPVLHFQCLLITVQATYEKK